LIVRTVNKIRRSDGSYISFNDNAVILVDKKNAPLGKRIF
jgi:large subunit ribosomal protein L14